MFSLNVEVGSLSSVKSGFLSLKKRLNKNHRSRHIENRINFNQSQLLNRKRKTVKVRCRYERLLDEDKFRRC